MRKIQVGMVIGSLEVGGSERQLLGLASRLDRGRFEARVCCLSHPGALAEAGVGDLPIMSLGLGRWPRGRWLHWTLGLRALFRRESLDVVHAYLFPSFALAALAATGLKTRVVAGIRSVGVGREGRWPFSVVESAGIGLVDRVAVNAEAVAFALQKRHPHAARKTQVIPNGIDPDSYEAVGDKDAQRRALGVPALAYLVAMIANLIPYKGHEDAIRALLHLRRSVPLAVLAFAGRGPHEPRLRSLAAELGLQDAVVFLGQLPDVRPLLAASDVVLLASHTEGLPNAVLEALAARRPVVATRVGGVPELVTHDVTGLLVEPCDAAGMSAALQRLAADKTLRGRLADNGRDLIERRFDWSHNVQAHEALYAGLCEAGARH